MGLGFSVPRRLLLVPLFMVGIGRACGQDQEIKDSAMAAPAQSQYDSSLRRLEVGLKFASIRTDCIGTEKKCGLPSFALGAGASVNLNRHFSLDTDVLVTPHSSSTATNFYGGRHSEYLIGVRAEARARHYGYFVTAQPGALIWDHVITHATILPNRQIEFNYGVRHYFVTNLAAGFEYSPSTRIKIRGEIGDLLKAFTRTSWSNNLQSSAGVYVGFGSPILWRPPTYDPRWTHRFFDKPNSALITASLLGMTADSITTQRFISRGKSEADPFARPLVKYGWSGQVPAVAIELSAEIMGMYGLHRIHQHWIERLAPAGIAIAHGFLAYHNDTISMKSEASPAKSYSCSR